MKEQVLKNKSFPFLNPLCLALDVDDKDMALRLVQNLNPQTIDKGADFFQSPKRTDSTRSDLIPDDLNINLCGGFKIGPRLVLKYGESIISQIAQYAPVFVDCKFFDITSTTVAAVRASFQAGASVVTVHAMNGYECLHELAKLEAELNSTRPFKILCVTILTSWSAKSFAEQGLESSILHSELTETENNKPSAISQPENRQSESRLSDSNKPGKTNWLSKDRPLTNLVRQSEISVLVQDLYQLVLNSGLRGIVCSAEELSVLKQGGLSEEVFFLTPGIRLPQDDHQDQSRVMGPRQALLAGSSALVVGRPILQAKNLRQKALQFLLD